MRFIAVVEIPAGESSELRSTLAKAAYRASRRGPVALLIPGDTNRRMDSELDSLVAADRTVHGVVYREPCDASVWKAANRDTLVVGSSPSAQQAAGGLGARCVDVASGPAELQDLLRQHPTAR